MGILEMATLGKELGGSIGTKDGLNNGVHQINSEARLQVTNEKQGLNKEYELHARRMMYTLP